MCQIFIRVNIYLKLWLNDQLLNLPCWLNGCIFECGLSRWDYEPHVSLFTECGY